MVRAQGLGRWKVCRIYDIIINENFRRRGYASRTLELVEARAKELGAKNVELHVFSHNHGAQALYEKVGYNVTSITMARPILTEPTGHQ